MSSNAPDANDPSSGGSQSTKRRARRPTKRLTGRKFTAPPTIPRIQLTKASEAEADPTPKPLLKPTHGTRFIFTEQKTARGTRLKKTEVTFDLRDNNDSPRPASTSHDDADNTILGVEDPLDTPTDDPPVQNRSSRGKVSFLDPHTI